MNKKLITGIVVFTVFTVSGIGTAYTLKNTYEHAAKYIFEKNKKFYDSKEIFATKDKASKLSLDGLGSYNDIIITKSPDENIRVKATTIKGVELSKVELKDSTLSIKSCFKDKHQEAKYILKDEFVDLNFGAFNGQKAKFVYSTKDIKEGLDYSTVINGYKIPILGGFFSDYDAVEKNTSVRKLEIALPNAVDIEFPSEPTSLQHIDIGEGMIKDSITAKNIAYTWLDNITYKGKIKNINLTLTTDQSIFYFDDDIELNVENMNINLPKYIALSFDSDAKNIKNINVNLVENNRKDAKKEFYNQYNSVFADEVKSDFESVIEVDEEMCDNLKINAGDNKVKLDVKDDFNPQTKIMSKNGIVFMVNTDDADYKVYSTDKSIDFNGVLFDYIKNFDMNLDLKAGTSRMKLELSGNKIYMEIKED